MYILKQLIPVVLIGITFPSFSGEKIEQSLPLNEVTNVSIENLRGKVTIRGSDNDKVSVKGELDDKAERFIFEHEGSHIKIKVVMPYNLNHDWNEKGSNLVITVPKQVKVDFTGVSSDVDVHNFNRSIEVKTVSGNITADDLTSLIDLTTVSGDIESKNLSGKIRLSTVSGDIDDSHSSGRIKIRSVSGNVESQSTATEILVNSVSGKINVKLDQVDELIVSTVSGNFTGQLTLSESGLIKMSSVSGDLNLLLNHDVQASFRFNSNAGGDLVNKLTSEKAQHAKYGPSSKLSFETGNASGSVRASTVSGQIKISGK